MPVFGCGQGRVIASVMCTNPVDHSGDAKAMNLLMFVAAQPLTKWLVPRRGPGFSVHKC